MGAGLTMGIGEALGKAYMKVEDAYYGVLDFFEEKGIGIPWAYNDFLESKGVPALPVTAALIILLVGSGLWVSTVNQPQTVSFTLALKDNKGRGLQDVSVQIVDSSGAVLKTLTASDGTIVTLGGISPNSSLTVKAAKSGYGTQTRVWYAGTDTLELALEGANDAIVGKLKLIDAETQTTITSASVRAEWAGGNTPLVVSPGTNGIILLNVPLDKEISIVVRADNYEDLTDTISFSNGDVKIKELTPKASASTGPSVLIVKAVDSKTQLPIETVHVKIENAATNEIISDLDAASGMHSENLTKGQVVRVSVSKEGYLTYTTAEDFPEGKTLRKENETILAPLTFGGAALHVLARSAANPQALQGVDVDLLDALEVKLDRQTSGFAGEAVFPGLTQVQKYTLLAFHPNFFPLRSTVDWSALADAEDGKTISLTLTPFTSGDAGLLSVFVSDAEGKAASLASVSVEEKVGEYFVPLLAARSVDSIGSFSARMKVGMVVRVNARTENGEASQEITIASGLNKVLLALNQNMKAVTFNLTYGSGQAFEGNIQIVTTGGTQWYNGAVSNGSMTALIPLNETLTLTAQSTAGQTYTRTLVVLPENDTVNVALDSTAGTVGSAPEITFDGLFSPDGQVLAGLSPDADALARFTVKWPAAAGKGKLFVRAGNESLASVDAQFVGIYGLNGDADSIAYGRSWTPTPKPGNESKDRRTTGKAGTLSKWIEIEKNSPLGTSTFDVRLRARAGTPEGMIPLAYRALVESNGNVIRTPNDSELGNAGYTPTKSGLYAATLSATIPVYASTPFCQSGICATLQFVDSDNRLYPPGNFQAQNGQLYAVQVSILPALAGSVINPSTVTQSTDAVTTSTATTTTTGTTTTSTGEGLIPLPNSTTNRGFTLKANTSNENPLLVFTKTEVGVFGPLTDTGNKDTSVSATIPIIDSQNGARARVQFAPQETGSTTLTLQIVSTTSAWTQTLPVEIVEPKLLNVTIPERANPQEAIPITVLDTQGNPLTSALITFTNANGKFSASVKGNDSPGKGENGRYLIDKSLDAGVYGVRVKVSGFVDAEATITIGISSPLSLPEKILISIPFGKTSTTQQVTITNTTAYPISNITGELETYSSFPSELKVEVGTIPALAPNGKGTITLTAAYFGEAGDETPRLGSGTLRVHGDAVQKFPLKGESALSVSYNSQLDPSCLQFNKDRLSVQIMGESQPFGNLYNGTSAQANPNIPYYGFSQSPNFSNLNAGSAPAQGYNALGYNASGYYQNAEQKRVSVNVQNNCGIDLSLIPGISIVDGQAEVDGLKLAAVDSALSLSKGQKKNVEFTITNDLYRAGFIPQQVQYAAVFRAAQVQASIPISIQFWDRSRAIQTPNSIELTLIKTGSQKATDRANVPITNIGSGVIYDLRAQLEGTAGSSDITIKLENNPGSAPVNSGQTANSNYPILASERSGRGSLQPGQSLYPPLAIVAESVRETAGDLHKTLTISGVIDGQRIALRQLDVYVRTGSSSCLQLSAFDTPISMVSSELTGTIGKRVTLQNKCLEPVRVTQVNPPSLGTNTFSLTPLVEGTGTLDKDAEQEFQLELSKGSAVKSQINLNVKGILLLTQKPIESNFIQVEVRLGKDELQSMNATNSVPVPICEGGTLNVRFPLLAKRNECSQAYCDAEQASGMLADAMEQTMAKVVQNMQAKKNDASQFSACDITKRYCTFSQLGVKSPTLDVYLQNDAVTSNIMNYVMRNGTHPRLAGMQAEVLTQLGGESADHAFAEKLGSGFGNKVFLPQLEGCGAYQLVLMGGVVVGANQLQPDQINIGFKLKNTVQRTAECQDKIYNAANFLPKDAGLSSSNSQGTLLGMVDYEPGLKQPAEWLAQTVFGSETRAQNNTSSNRLYLRVGNLNESIIEMTLDPSTAGEGTKKIYTTVRKTGGDIQKEVVVEAGKIISNLGKGVKGCITQDEQTWRIYSAPDVGEFTFSGCALPGTSEGGLTVRSTLTCCTLTAKSDIAGDASFNAEPRGNDALPGVTKLDLYESKEPLLGSTLARPGEKIENNSPYPLTFNNPTRAYEKQILLCTTADARTQQLANNAIVQTSTTRTLDETKAGPLKLQLKTCALDASDALARAHGKSSGTYYATLDWADDVDKKTILQTVEEATAKNKLGNAYVSYAGQGILANDNPVYKEKLEEKKMASLGTYAASCAVACGICQGGLALATWGASLGASAMDCLLACGTGVAAGGYELYKETADGTILEGPKDVVEATYGIVRDGVSIAIPGSGENEPASSALVAGGILYPTIRSLKNPLETSITKKIKDLDEATEIKGSASASAAADAKEAAEKATAEFDEATRALKTATEEKSVILKETKDAVSAATKGLNDAKIDLTAAQSTETTMHQNWVQSSGQAKTQARASLDQAIRETNLAESKVNKIAAELKDVQKTANAAKKMIADEINSLNAKLKPTTLPAGAAGPQQLPLEDVAKNAKKASEAAAKAAKEEAAAKATKLKYGQFARGLVCGLAGNAAGYYAYRENLTQEIENKIELETGSTNVLDPNTGVLTFIKGQTYKFNVQPGTGTGNSQKIFVDIVSPDTLVDGKAWLDDCAQK